MSKPEDIPQDVWDAAYAVAVLCGATLAVGAVEVVARAIMAERERCAAACDEFDAPCATMSEFVNGQATASQQIRAAIRRER